MAIWPSEERWNSFSAWTVSPSIGALEMLGGTGRAAWATTAPVELESTAIWARLPSPVRERRGTLGARSAWRSGRVSASARGWSESILPSGLQVWMCSWVPCSGVSDVAGAYRRGGPEGSGGVAARGGGWADSGG